MLSIEIVDTHYTCNFHTLAGHHVKSSMSHNRLYKLVQVSQTGKVIRTCDLNMYHTQLFHICDNDAKERINSSIKCYNLIFRKEPSPANNYGQTAYLARNFTIFNRKSTKFGNKEELSLVFLGTTCTCKFYILPIQNG